MKMIIAILASGLFVASACRSQPPPERESGPPVLSAEEVQETSREVCPSAFREVPISSGRYTGYDVDGDARSFVLLLPEEAARSSAPLFVAFHGTTETGASFVERARLSEFAAAGMIVVAPDAVGHGTIWPVWDALRMPGNDSPNPDLAFFDSLLKCLSSRLHVDEERVFVGGHSAGGIMTNHVLQHRSKRVAGGIVGSGVFELTGHGIGPDDLAAMTVIVTWGGVNDVYRGRTGDGTRIEGFHFAEQGALASRFYAEAEAIRHFHCRGDERGHAWLHQLNPWMIETLLGSREASGSPPRRAGVATCARAPAELPETPYGSPVCEAEEEQACERFCQVTADCLLANATLGPLFVPRLDRLGVSPTSCSRCTDQCQRAVQSSPADRAVVECLGAEGGAPACGPGISGALPLIERVNTCCGEGSETTFCRGICAGIRADDAAAAFFSFCRD